MPRLAVEEILELSVAERVQLAEDIWDTIDAQPELLSITEAQRRELDRRLAAADADPASACFMRAGTRSFGKPEQNSNRRRAIRRAHPESEDEGRRA
jgi:putative addiction module component (TIGR02574 family)